MEPTTAVTTIEPAPMGGAALLRDPKELRETLASFSEAREILLGWIRKQLVPGVDYGVIHRKARGQPCPNKDSREPGACHICKAKPTLLKPGAEKIDALFQVKPTFTRDTETWEMFGSKPGLICLKCDLVSQNGAGVSIAEGRGARSVEQDYGVENTTLKMCEKSGQVDATLRMGGLSEIFTQDLEDFPVDPKAVDAEADAAFPRLRPKAKPPATAPVAPADPPLSSRDMREPADTDHPAELPVLITQGAKDQLEGAINDLAKTFNMKPKTLRDKVQLHMFEKWKIQHFLDLSVEQYDTVLKWLGTWRSELKARRA